MDRNTNYAGQVPLETDLLKTNQFAMVGLAKLSAAIFGTGGVANGFATSQTVVPSMAVLVQPGEIYQSANLEATAYSSLAADTAHQVVKQGIALNTATLNTPAPGTAGFSVNYLIQATYQDSDTGSTVLPYYNASNPSVAYSGPANSGTAQPTTRSGIVVLSAKAGTAATTGTQTTPAPDAGYVGLYVVTVANGASTVLNANISAYSGAPILSSPVMNGRLLNIQVITSTQAYIPTVGTKNCFARGNGGGAAGGGAVSTATGNTSAGLGGSAGAYFEGYYPVASLAGQTVTIGAGGTGVANAAGNGGGATSIGAVVTAPGGSGGGPGQNLLPPWLLGEAGNSSAATGGNIVNAQGPSGGAAFSLSTAGIVSGRGGSSPFGAGGNQRGTLRGAGFAGTGPGAGGSGALEQSAGAGGLAGGNGVAGVVEIWEFA